MIIDSILNGVVLDHIPAGKGMEIYQYLHLDQLDVPVAIIKNAASPKMGKKDILKIDGNITLQPEALGYIAPGITVNVIRDGKLVGKENPELPRRLINVRKCKNPRCITCTEPELDQVFVIRDDLGGEYRCLYCES